MIASAVRALARRDFELQRSYRLSLSFDLAWGLIDLLLYFYISDIVDPTAEELGAAPSYFAFATAGIVMSLVIYATSTEVAYRVRDEQLTGTLEMLCAQPLRPIEIALGLTAFPLVFALARSVVYLAFAGLVLGLEAPDADWAGVIVMLLTAAVAFAPLGILAAAATIVFKRATSVAASIVFAMTFVSGALVPVSVLPEWLQRIGEAMPTWFAFEGLRSALFAGEGWQGDAGGLVLFAVVALPVSIWLFAASLAHARRTGTLSQY